MEQKFLCISGPFHDKMKTHSEAGLQYIQYNCSYRDKRNRTAILVYYCLAKKEVFEIWMTQGQDSSKVGEKFTLKEAIKTCKKYQDQGSFGIKMPDGSWYEWEK